MALEPTGHVAEHATFKIASLGASAPWRDIPIRLVEWLERNPQDVIFINACEQADARNSLSALVGARRLRRARYCAAVLECSGRL